MTSTGEGDLAGPEFIRRSASKVTCWWISSGDQVRPNRPSQSKSDRGSLSQISRWREITRWRLDVDNYRIWTPDFPEGRSSERQESYGILWNPVEQDASFSGKIRFNFSELWSHGLSTKFKVRDASPKRLLRGGRRLGNSWRLLKVCPNFFCKLSGVLLRC